MTRQRRQVLDFLAGQPVFRSAQDVHTGLTAAGHRIGLATVYRTLQLLAEAGEVDTVRTDVGELVFRRCISSSHHHHLICRSCDRVLEVEDGPVLDWVEALCEASGFIAERHILEIIGTCGRCR